VEREATILVGKKTTWLSSKMDATFFSGVGTKPKEIFMKKLFVTTLVLLGFLTFNGPGHAALVFQDNFNTENGGNYALNYNGFTNWTVSGGGTVDLIGFNSPWDLYPGNGLYVDLDGSTSQAGILATRKFFAAGTYLVEFTLAGNARSGYGGDTVVVNVGDWTKTFTLASNAPFSPQSFIAETSGGPLTFSNQGGDNVGAILDNVSVSTVPIPPTVYLLSAGLVGLYGLRRKSWKKQS
jgi:hypothetical protein